MITLDVTFDHGAVPDDTITDGWDSSHELGLQIVSPLGFDTVDAGSLASSRTFEPESGAYTPIYAADLEVGLGAGRVHGVRYAVRASRASPLPRATR